MKRNSKRLHFLIALTLSTHLSICFAEDTNIKLIDLPLEELLKLKITSVSRTAESLAQVPMSVYLVTAEEMNRWGVRNLFETLQRVPGFSFYNTDYYGQYGVISRGLQSVWRFGMSIELMPINDWGHFIMPKKFFKSIEVARGPGGLMWGSSAAAGLFNFTIRDDLNKKTEATVEIGNVGRKALTLAYGSKIGEDDSNNSFFVGWHVEEQDYVTQKNAYNDPNLTWRENGILPSYSFLTKTKFDKIKLITWFERDSHVSPDIWYAKDRATATQIRNDLDRLNGPAHDDTDIEAVRAEYHILNTEESKLYLYTDYYRRNWRTEGIFTSVNRSSQVGFASVNHLMDNKWEVTFGGNFFRRYDKGSPKGTTKLGQSYDVDFVGDSPIHTSKHYNDFYFQNKYHLTKNFAFLAGLRADNQSSEGILLSGPRLGAFYSNNNIWAFKYLYNSAKRRPQENEIGQGLAPERLDAHEFVTMFTPNNKMNANITLYTQTLSNEMFRANNGSFNVFNNGGGLTSNGVEWAINYNPVNKLLTYWNGSYNLSKVTSKSVLVNNVPVESAPHNNQKRPLFVPKLTSFLGSEYSFSDNLKLNFALRTITNIPYRDRAGRNRDTSVNFIDTTIRSQKLSKHELEISFSVLNIFDNQQRVPALGEHSNNSKGTLAPESRRYYIQVTKSF